MSRTVGILVYDDVQPLDVAGPLDTFGAANAAVRRPAYQLHTIGRHGTRVRTENGLVLTPDYATTRAPALDTLVIPGGAGSRRALAADAAFLGWLRSRAATTRRVVSICTGSYLLAAAGLLDGRRATTHWRFAADFAQRFPAVHLDPAALFVEDGRFHTSGGLTAGLDLTLSLVEADLGSTVALAAARDLVMYLKRPGNQAQYSAPLDTQVRGGSNLSRLAGWLLDHLHEPLTIDRLAEEAAMSPRHFRRCFRTEFGTTPARHVERLRLERACALLTTTQLALDGIAAATGYQSADAFRRAFRLRYATSPADYRAHFVR